MFRYLFAMCFTFIPPLAMADNAEMPSNTEFSSFAEVRNAISALSINPEQVDWNDIDFYCSGLVGNSSQTKLNTCRYNGARSQYNFNEDKSFCFRSAEADYPDSLVGQPRDGITVTETNTSGQTTTKKIVKDGYTMEELQKLRSKMLFNCLTKDRKWKDPMDWHKGKIQ